MRVLGIDPGMADTGWAVLQDTRAAPCSRLLSSGLIRTPARTGLPERLKAIHGAVARVIAEHRPDRVAIEEMFFLKAAHSVRATLQARGVILLACAQSGVPVSEYNPRQVKSALTGDGNAAKPQMQRMAQRLLELEEPLQPDDVADAAAIALCHMRQLRNKGLHILERIGARK